MTTSSIITRASLILIPLSLFGFGCNPVASIQEKAAEKMTEGIINQATGGKAKVDINNNAVTFKDNKTGESYSYGEDVKIPDDFPKDVVIYPGSKAIAVINAGDKDRASNVSLTSTDSVAKILTWYTDEMKKNGWTEASSVTAGTVEMRTYEKDRVQISVTIVPQEEDDDTAAGTGITVTRTEKSS